MSNEGSDLLSMVDLRAILSPHVARFGRAIWPVWDRFPELPEEHRLAYDPTTEANVLHSYMVRNAKSEFTNVAGVHFLEQHGFHLGIDGSFYGVDGLAVCRLKKLSEDGASRNYPTMRAEALRRNDPLPGMPADATYVDIGYVLTPLRTGIIMVHAVRVYDSELIFSIPRSGDVTHINESLPFGPMAVEPRFHIINGAKRKVDVNNGNR